MRLLQRWVGAVLAVTLLTLAAAAVLGSWRQAEIVRTTTVQSAHTDAYEQAVHLSVVELGLLQDLLVEPAGDERDREREQVAQVGAQLTAALERLAAHDNKRHGEASGLVDRQRGLQPVIARYLSLLERGETTAAARLLEEEIEPVAEETLSALGAERKHHDNQYLASLARAERDAWLLQVGTLLTFVLGLVVLGVLGWLSRSHRRVIERMAAHDALTDLPNRAAFEARAKLAFAKAKAGGARPTVLMLDLDGFKDVNDSLGHHTGDLLLVQVGQRLRGCVRQQDTVTRLGGDEFAVLILDADPETGERTAERITEALNTPFVIDNVTLDIEISIGIATADPGQDVATVVRHADTAMYAAKEHRLGYARFDQSQANDTFGRLTMLGDLRRALDTDEIEVHYQPKISVDTGELIGAEALARWRHPVRGLVAPGEFIPVLEATSLVRRFTTHVLGLALARARVWLDAGHHVPVAVNVSTRCLLDSAFPDTVAQALLAAGVPGNLLCIEITENTVMADPERAIDVLRRIRDLGVKTAIDDFGTGYSSMAYLKILPVDEIKVDRSFVRDMATDRSNYVLVESAVDLGHNLGLAVTAEGVENHPTMVALQQLGCDIAQGYHFARPLAAADFTQYLKDHNAPQNTSAVACPDPTARTSE